MMRNNGPPPPPPPPPGHPAGLPPGHGPPPGGMGSHNSMMSKLHHCEIHMKPKKHYNFLQIWLNKFPSRAKKIDVISREEIETGILLKISKKLEFSEFRRLKLQLRLLFE